MIVLSEYIYKDNTVYLNENLTYYRQTKKYHHQNSNLSKIWYNKIPIMIILNFFARNKIRFKPNTDYIVTKLINRFFK